MILQKHQLLKNKYVNKYYEKFYINSLFISLSRLVNVGSGFLFWVLAAKFYSINDVGLGSALISSATLLISVSRLGFDLALIRFLPTRDKEGVFNSCLIITTITTLVACFIYIKGINYFSPHFIIYWKSNLLNHIFSLCNKLFHINDYGKCIFGPKKIEPIFPAKYLTVF